jgi:helix-turn-helix protein
MARPLLGHIPAWPGGTTGAGATGHHEGIVVASLKLGQAPCLVVPDHPHSAQALCGPVGEGLDEPMIVAEFIKCQRTTFGIPHAIACRALGVSQSWVYKSINRVPTARQQRRARLDEEIRRLFTASGGTYGSPRITDDLREAG